MRNIERIRAMDADQLADFLVESGAEVPTEFCDILCVLVEGCEECLFCGPGGDRKAWKIWLESEYDREEKEDGQKPQEPETVQADEQNDSEQAGNDEKDPQQDAGRDV